MEALPTRELVAAVDAALPERAVVFGSLPPEGRDLDLLAGPAAAAALAAELGRRGFARKGDSFALFGACSAFGVDVGTPGGWGLPDDEAAALRDLAEPLEGYARLARPAPEHELLVLARLLVGDGALRPKRRARLEALLARAPEAWERAERRAAAWRAERALLLLRAAWETGATVPRAERLRALGPRAALPLPHRPAVVAFSGLDGAGKSSQATALADALERLGYEAEVHWAPVDGHRVLELASAAPKAVLRRVRRGSFREEFGSESVMSSYGETPREAHGLQRAVREGWVALNATVTATSQLATALRAGTRGRVVIFDRHALDAAVRLRVLYGGEFPAQKAIVRALWPRTRLAYLLEIPAEVARARKPDDIWSLEQLRAQERMLRAEAPRFGVRVVDGQRPREELCAEIARETWLALP